jgi:hypothetical protein
MIVMERIESLLTSQSAIAVYPSWGWWTRRRYRLPCGANQIRMDFYLLALSTYCDYWGCKRRISKSYIALLIRLYSPHSHIPQRLLFLALQDQLGDDVLLALVQVPALGQSGDDVPLALVQVPALGQVKANYGGGAKSGSASSDSGSCCYTKGWPSDISSLSNDCTMLIYPQV